MTESILGPFFDTSTIPDCRADLEKKYYLLDEYATAATKIQDGLQEILICLLENTEMRERVLEYIGEMIKKNSTRAQTQHDPNTCASSGAFVNLSIVMLRLCDSFLDPNLSKQIDIDPSYIFFNTRLDFSVLTTLNASSSEFAEFKKSNGAGKPNYLVNCELFFLTARALHLGLIQAIDEYKAFSRNISEGKKKLSTLKNLCEHYSSKHLEQEIIQQRIQINKFKEVKSSYEAHLKRDVKYLKRALGFYKSILVWLVDLVGGFKMPLPSTCPKLFVCMPEHFVEDAMNLLLFASRIPEALDGVMLNDFVKFIIMFMATPEYIRNPYLRKKMVQVLELWTRKKNTVPLFEGDELVIQNLVGNCLKLYVDIEVTLSDMADDKFNIRHNIVRLLYYLRKVPSHRIAWTEIAGKKDYLNFLNFLISDSFKLLDGSFNNIAELNIIEAEMCNEDEWKRKPAREKEDILRQLDQHKHLLQRYFFSLAMDNMRILESTAQLTTAPFILPEMVETVANMLNCLLVRVVGLEKNYLSTLLEKIIGIYIHLERGDENNVFASAISRDGRSYNHNLFNDAADIFAREGGNSMMTREFTEIGDKAKTACLEALAIEEALGDIPEEFLDPITCALMTDPVILPSTKITMDRPVIQKHLLSDTRDPFNRSALTHDMLIPHVELKAKIEEFIRSKSQRCCRHAKE